MCAGAKQTPARELTKGCLCQLGLGQSAMGSAALHTLAQLPTAGHGFHTEVSSVLPSSGTAQLPARGTEHRGGACSRHCCPAAEGQGRSCASPLPFCAHLCPTQCPGLEPALLLLWVGLVQHPERVQAGPGLPMGMHATLQSWAQQVLLHCSQWPQQHALLHASGSWGLPAAGEGQGQQVQVPGPQGCDLQLCQHLPAGSSGGGQHQLVGLQGGAGPFVWLLGPSGSTIPEPPSTHCKLKR